MAISISAPPNKQGRALLSRIKTGDALIIVVVLLAALLGLVFFVLLPGGGLAQSSAKIYVDGELLQSIPLSAGPQELRLEGDYGYNVLLVGPQGVQVLEADCLNQDCVQAGLISRPGGILACLPHRLLVRLTGPKAGELDAISN